MKYQGRSINKLQNDAVSLILKISKIRNMRYILQINQNTPVCNLFIDRPSHINNRQENVENVRLG